MRLDKDPRPARHIHIQLAHQEREVIDHNTGQIKLSIQSFQGKNDPDIYIELERKVEHIFDCHNYSELKKVKLAVVAFTNSIIVWWDHWLLITKEIMIENWKDKFSMRQMFVPSHYYRNLHLKLQSPKQGLKNAKEYFKEMETTMIHANIEEDRRRP